MLLAIRLRRAHLVQRAKEINNYRPGAPRNIPMISVIVIDRHISIESPAHFVGLCVWPLVRQQVECDPLASGAPYWTARISWARRTHENIPLSYSASLWPTQSNEERSPRFQPLNSSTKRTRSWFEATAQRWREVRALEKDERLTTEVSGSELGHYKEERRNVIL